MSDEDEDFQFFDPTDMERMLLPQRKLAARPAGEGMNSGVLYDVDGVKELKSKSTSVASMTRIRRKKDHGSTAAFLNHNILSAMYKFLPYEDLIIQSRTSRDFYKALRKVPLNLTCHGERARMLCSYLSGLAVPNSTIRILRLGEERDTIRETALNDLCVAFQNAVVPRLTNFHIEINPDTGEQGIFTLIDAMLTNPLNELRCLDFEGSYIGQKSARKLADILASKKFSMVEELNLSRNGMGEQGTKFMVKGLVSNGGACPKLKVLNLERNDVGKGWRTIPKALGGDAFKSSLVDFNCSNNNITGDAMRIAADECHGGIEHVLKYLNFSYNDLGDIGAARFVNLFLGFSTSIIKLHLSSIDGQTKFALGLAKAIEDSRLPHLEHLDIGKNAIARQGIERLSQALETGRCPGLRHLDLSVCSMTSSGISLLCQSIRSGCYDNLRHLDLSANNAQASMVFIAEVLKEGRCGELRKLIISKNSPMKERKGLPFCFRDVFFKNHKWLVVVDDEDIL
ncbi:hypothetical protein TrST_g8105 [Triparma strigata]|uniref:Uncharacterized protein n=1 Tax=Triparma strigata TaxID=1606541 RepID=A0A9W7C9D4_9STRA|nr:hypothetical protein TrST_g8105 [Triparma strigata]